MKAATGNFDVPMRSGMIQMNLRLTVTLQVNLSLYRTQTKAIQGCMEKGTCPNLSPNYE